MRKTIRAAMYAAIQLMSGAFAGDPSGLKAAEAMAAMLPRSLTGNRRSVLNLLGRNPGSGDGARRAAARFKLRISEERQRLAGGPAAF